MITLYGPTQSHFYLAERYDGGRWPASVVDRAHAIQWTFWVMTEAERAAIDFVSHTLTFPAPEHDPKAAAAAEQLAAPFAIFDRALRGRECLVGEDFDVGDVNVAAALAWCVPGGFDFADLADLKRWLDTALARPAVAAALRA